MKIVIISDIHDNLASLEKCLKWCAENGVEKILCCGDITNSDTLAFLSLNFKGDIYLARGNADLYDEGEVLNYGNIIYCGDGDCFDFNGKKAGICHEPFRLGKLMIENFDCSLIFYGHTHKPWEEIRKNKVGKEVKLVNPGTLGGVFYKATFALWDTENGKLTLKILEFLDKTSANID